MSQKRTNIKRSELGSGREVKSEEMERRREEEEDRAHRGDLERSLLSFSNSSSTLLPCYQVGRLLDTGVHADGDL